MKTKKKPPKNICFENKNMKCYFLHYFDAHKGSSSQDVCKMWKEREPIFVVGIYAYLNYDLL